MTFTVMAERCYAVWFVLNVTYAECHLLALYAECRGALAATATQAKI